MGAIVRVLALGAAALWVGGAGLPDYALVNVGRYGGDAFRKGGDTFLCYYDPHNRVHASNLGTGGYTPTAEECRTALPRPAVAQPYPPGWHEADWQDASKPAVAFGGSVKATWIGIAYPLLLDYYTLDFKNHDKFVFFIVLKGPSKHRSFCHDDQCETLSTPYEEGVPHFINVSKTTALIMVDGQILFTQKPIDKSMSFAGKVFILPFASLGNPYGQPVRLQIARISMAVKNVFIHARIADLS